VLEFGEFVGDYKKWYENGQLQEGGIYTKDGKKDGVWAYYSQDGQLTKSESYQEGKLIEEK